ncbi:MAG TPA: MBL fold metallo-hydrolase [Bryobacteraceae bacterium]|nr:MBL fold metallo-hydrolase [Bryobacteraceae bacterium]
MTPREQLRYKQSIPMIHEMLAVGPLLCNCSIFGDAVTGDAIVVDPGDGIEEILRLLAKHRLKAKAIVITHGHIDHVGAAAALKEATDAPIYLHEDDLPIYARVEMQAMWLGLDPPKLVDIDAFVRDGDVLRVGQAEFTVLHTPGHTPGGIGLWMPGEKKLIAGDTLFRESIGRTDLPGGDPQRILVSIREKFLPLPDETLVIPGHGPTTTVGHEKRHNYFLQRM